MNDPKPFFWNGSYHVFFQHNPHGAFWGTMHWGHAVSRDLLHWEELPVALAPTPGGPDKDGCFTGCVVKGDEDRFHILYTGVDPQVQCLATSDDPNLIVWRKYEKNPVIGEKPAGFGACFRDPQAWKEADGTWLMVVGSELSDRRGGAALLYQSPDGRLTDWEFVHALFAGHEHETGFDFECPDFFPLGHGGWRVLLSSRNKTWWHAGDFDRENLAFERAAWGPTDGGGLFYAAKTLFDDQNRRLLFGWIREDRPENEQKAAGWSGVLSLPRVLSRLPDGALGQEPAREIETLRAARTTRPGVRVPGNGAGVPLGTFPDTLETQVRFAPNAPGERLGLRLEWTDGARLEIAHDRTANRLNDAPLTLAPGEPLTLRVFVDRSVVEVFANGRACQTLRVYPKPEALGRVTLALFAHGGSVTADADVWEMTAAPVERRRRKAAPLPAQPT